jgi:Phage Mu protein F like protein
VAQRQRAALLRGDRAVSRTVLAAYYKAWQSINARLAVLGRQLTDARDRGEAPSVGWLAEQGRLQGLKAHVEAEVAAVAARLGPLLTGEQARWAAQAQTDTAEQVAAARSSGGGRDTAEAGTTFARLNPVAVVNVIGYLSNGSPLADLLAQLGPDAAERVGEALTQGVLLGRSPRETARLCRRALGGSAARALLISRDATLNAYREGAHQTYRANADVVARWVWTAALSSRSCASCLAMSGTRHPLSERLRSHPACRCCPVPLITDEPPPQAPKGTAWFDAQPADVQRRILGPKKYAALEAGEIALEDLSVVRRSRRWGSHRAEASLAEARAQAARRRERAA